MPGKMARCVDLLSKKIHSQTVYDIAVIGGGATGLGVALKAAASGFSVVVLESHDFASGTSSRSTKLLHGGVRYLAQGNIHLVKEALQERSAIMHQAPHLAQALQFVVPAYRWWQWAFYGIGLKIYDKLAASHGLGRTCFLNRQQTLDALPGLQANHLQGGIQYWDGQFDDARLALALVKTIERCGGTALNYLTVQQIQPLDPVHHQGARFKLTAQDVRQQQMLELRCKTVINATGVWVDQIRQQASHRKQQPLVSASQGVHLVVSRDFMPGQQALLIPKTSDGRVLFAVPWLGSLILGTTDTPTRELPREPQPLQQEIDFILTEASRVLSKKLQRSDIQSIWVGLRPLVAQAAERADTKQLSREHTILVEPNGMVTVTGGKWTTYRVMATDALKACMDAGLLPPCELKDVESLVGTETTGQQAIPITRPPGLHLYGSEAPQVMALPGADHWLTNGLNEAMVRFAARHEMALTVEDMLARRSRLLFLNARQALNIAEQVAAILQEETGFDPALAEFRQLAHKYADGP
jgi:glycerol-3-phosphate dehydrogenase